MKKLSSAQTKILQALAVAYGSGWRGAEDARREACVNGNTDIAPLVKLGLVDVREDYDSRRGYKVGLFHINDAGRAVLAQTGKST
jgi:hypothetical protein